MQFITIAVLAVTLAVPSLATAQPNRSSTAVAPRGHRQPNVKDTPQDQANPQANPSVAMTKEDKALERALKGICRGC